jgi:hypothetical protein
MRQEDRDGLSRPMRIKCGKSIGRGFPAHWELNAARVLGGISPPESVIEAIGRGNPALTFHPLLPSRIFSKSLMSVKVRAANKIRAIAIKLVGVTHLGRILSEEPT